MAQAVRNEANRTLLRNAVRVEGHGPPVVLIHGFGCDQTMWDALAPRLGRGHQIVRYDLTGMGGSHTAAYDQLRHGSLHGHAQDLIEIIEALGSRPVVAIGHSVSAMIAMLAANARPDLFRALVMIGPSPYYINDGDYTGGFTAAEIHGLLDAMEKNFLGWNGQLAGLVAGPDASESQAILNQRFCRNDPTIAKHFAKVTFLADNRDDLAKVQVPTLIIQSRHDVIASPVVGAYVQSRIPGARLTTLECRGHAPHMTAPEATAQAIRNFLGELPP